MSEVVGVPTAEGERRPSNGASAVAVLCAIGLCLLCLGVRSRMGTADSVVLGAVLAVVRLILALVPLALLVAVVGMLLTPSARRRLLPWLVAAACIGFAGVSIIAAIDAARLLRASDLCVKVGLDRAGAVGDIVRVRWFPPIAECSVFTGPGDDSSVVVSHWAVWLPVLAVPLAALAVSRALRLSRRLAQSG